MGRYSTSQATRTAFIMAAGELFTEHGVNAVGIRDIADRAGENMGNIHYHFGGKKGLLKAVIDYALEPCYNNVFGKYFDENEPLLATRAGQARVVAGMINLHFETVFAENRPLWCGVLVAQLLEKRLPVSDDIFENGVMPFIDSFFRLYRKISGDNEVGNVLGWLTMVVAPAQLMRQNMGTIRRVQKIYKIKKDVSWKKLRDMVICGALVNLDLAEDADDVLKSLNPQLLERIRRNVFIGTVTVLNIKNYWLL